MYNFCRKVSLGDWKKFMRKENCQRKQCLRGSTKTCQIWESAFSDFFIVRIITSSFICEKCWFFHSFQTMAFKGPECLICYEGYNDEKKCPRLLSCGHTFCSSCLERLLHGNSIDCPKCRHAVAVPTGVQGLLKNFALLDIVKEAPKEQAGHTEHTGTHDCEACDEKHPATFCCLDCKENFCKTAAQFHKRSKASRDHRVVSLEELKANPQLASVPVFFPEHNDQFRFFDKDCGRVICRDCYALNHSGHKCVIVAEAASKYR